MNPTQITGTDPDFIVARRLTALAHELFAADGWTHPINLDEDQHELILTMHDVGLIEMTISLVDGVQVVLWRLKE